MYRRPRFLELLIKIREEMAREADFDVDLFVERVRSGAGNTIDGSYTLSDDDKPKRAKRQKRDKPK